MFILWGVQWKYLCSDCLAREGALSPGQFLQSSPLPPGLSLSSAPSRKASWLPSLSFRFHLVIRGLELP